MDNYAILLQKVEEFRRKYYTNRLIKGVFISLFLTLLAYISFSTLVYFGKFDSLVRTIFFYTLVLSSLAVFAYYIFIPILKIFHFGKTISNEEASKIIGNHFKNVQDKLINTLQLKELTDKNPQTAELILASIDQKINQLKPVPFRTAIDYRKNSKYARLALIPILLLVVILFTNSNLITEGTKRLVNYDVDMENMEPFSFDILNKNLSVAQGDDIAIQLELGGKEIPEEIIIISEEKEYRMIKNDKNNFVYTFKNMQKNTDFYFAASGFRSVIYHITTYPKASLLAYSIELTYPAYTGIPKREIKNEGDITIPEGTLVKWKFKTKNANQLSMIFEDTTLQTSADENTEISLSKRFRKSSMYKIFLANSLAQNRDTLQFKVHTISDENPKINAIEEKDSASKKWIYFAGTASDDYKLQKVSFYYKFTKSENAKKPLNQYKIVNISNKYISAMDFTYTWDLEAIGLEAGDELEYYFEACDNDGINGSKCSKTEIYNYKTPSKDALSKEASENSAAMKSEMSDALKESTKINKDIEKLQRKMIEKKSLSWEDKQQLEKLLERQKELQKKIDEIQKKNKVNDKKENEFKKEDKELLKKQEELQKLFEQAIPDELKKKMEELEKMMNELNKDEIKKQLENMQLDNKQVNKQLDRMLEMYKQLEVEKKLKENIEKLDELSKKQEDLKEKTEKTNPEKNDDKKLSEEQQKLNEEFKKLEKEMKDLDKKNEELEKPKDLEMDKLEEEMKDIEKEMEESKEEIDKNENKKASKKQKDAADKMKEMKEKMEEKMEKEEEEKQEEDYDKLRQILENLVTVSKDQESIMNEVKSLNSYNPRMVNSGQREKKLKDDFKIIEDSLQALSKRVTQIQSYINKEVNLVNKHVDLSLENIGERNAYQAASNQQYAMTSMNNLAVMLSEVLKNMQEEMNANSSGKGKPKKSKPKNKSAKDLKKMQEELSKQIEGMKNKLGEKGKDGKEGKGGESGVGSEAWARIAAQQQMIRQQLNEIQKQMQKEGNGGKLGDLQKTQKLMDDVEKDLVNKRITPETLNRLKQLETRMLEHEKAEQEQETDKERKAESGKELERKLPPSLEKYLKEKNKELELYQNVPSELKPYYKEKVKEYYRLLQQ